jgi:hypothetical protein
VPPNQLSPEWLANKPPIVVLVSALVIAIGWLVRENLSYRQRNDALSETLLRHIETVSSERSGLIKRLDKVSRRRSGT